MAGGISLIAKSFSILIYPEKVVFCLSYIVGCDYFHHKNGFSAEQEFWSSGIHIYIYIYICICNAYSDKRLLKRKKDSESRQNTSIGAVFLSFPTPPLCDWCDWIYFCSHRASNILASQWELTFVCIIFFFKKMCQIENNWYIALYAVYIIKFKIFQKEKRKQIQKNGNSLYNYVYNVKALYKFSTYYYMVGYLHALLNLIDAKESNKIKTKKNDLIKIPLWVVQIQILKKHVSI